MNTIGGVVSGVRERADVVGNRDQVQTQRSVHLRIGNRAAFMKSSPNLVDGDVVTAAGKDGAEFRIVALRNDTTGVIYSELRVVPTILLAVLIILMSPVLIFLIFPTFLMIGMGIWLICRAVQVSAAEKLLRSMPAQTLVQ